MTPRDPSLTAVIARTVADVRATVAGLPHPVGLVPTMGALHEGHLALVRKAAADCASVVVSIFVNPTQFGPDEDFVRYPRDEARDVTLVTAAGADVVFAPAAAEMYRPGAATTVRVAGELTTRFEAAERPDHFDAVATVVTKLLDIVAPDRAYFGRKDAQQLAVVRRLVDDLDLPVEVVPVDTVREPDGLALSSRNAYLSDVERAKAPELYQALLAGREVATRGPKAIVDEVTAKLVVGFPPYIRAADEVDAPPQPVFSVDYVAVVDPDTFEAVTDSSQAALRPDSLIVAAARLGETRLLDNLAVGAGALDFEAAHQNDGPIPQEPDPPAGPASIQED